MNLNYNNNSIRIDDETFDLHGDTTLFSLRNGGGKTVLVQIIMSLFVNKSSRDFADRPFRSYFTTSKPTFVMVEWKLDHGQGYFLTGMMVRKSQNPDENSNEDLDLINFTGSYRNDCEYSLDTLSVIENFENNKKLKGFGECKKLFDKLKTDGKTDFNYYDMASQYSRRQYFTKLKEYQIDNREWEGIIKKVNLKESGLSELFSKSKDEKGLIENWFIDEIERKLNTDHNKIKEFQKLAYKLIRQYRDNQSSIRRKQVIEQFFDDSKVLNGQMEIYLEKQKTLDNLRNVMAAFAHEVTNQIHKMTAEKQFNVKEIENIQSVLYDILQSKYSYFIYQLEDERAIGKKERSDIEIQITKTEYAINHTEKEISRYECAGIFKELKEYESGIAKITEQMNAVTAQKQDYKEEIEQMGATLFQKYHKKYQSTIKNLEEKVQSIKELKDSRGDYQADKERMSEELNQLKHQQGQLEQLVNQYDQNEEKFNRRYHATLVRTIIGIYEEGSLELQKREYEDELTGISNKITRLTEKTNELKQENDSLVGKVTENKVTQNDMQNFIQRTKEQQDNFEAEKTTRQVYMKYVEAPEIELNNKLALLNRFHIKIQTLELQKEEFLDGKKLADKEYYNLKQGKVIELPKNIAAYFEEENITYKYGMEWLKNNGRTVQENQRLVEENPFIPYCIIVDEAAVKRIYSLKSEIYTEFPIPIVRRENLEKGMNAETGCVHFDGIDFFVMFNRHLLNVDELEKVLEQKKKQIAEYEEKIEKKTGEIQKYREYKNAIESQSFTLEKIEQCKDEVKKAEEQLHLLKEEYAAYQQKKKSNEEQLDVMQREIDDSKRTENTYRQREEEFQELVLEYEKYLINLDQKSRNINKQKENEDKQKKITNLIMEVDRNLERENEIWNELERDKKEYSIKLENYRGYETFAEGEFKDADVSELEARYEALTSKISATLEDLKERLNKENNRYERKRHELEQKNTYQLEEKEYSQLRVTDTIFQNLKKTLKDLGRERNQVQNRIIDLEKEDTRKETKLEQLHKELFEKTNRETLVEKSALVKIDFDAEYRLKKYEKKNLEQKNQQLEQRILYFQSISTTLAEYAQIDSSSFQPALEKMTKEEIQDYLKNQLQKVREASKKLEEEQRNTDKIIRDMAAKSDYQDDFFSKSFAGLISLSDQVYLLKEQLETYYLTYHNMLEKLQIDLENIEKERKNVEEIFLEYIQSIDENIRMIDRNSTINVRGKNLKMLRINVPDWESGKEYYQMKLNAYVESFISRGINAVSNNENVEEILGKVVTTKRLYDEIVGISNITIKMYKIEAEREVLISWSEVSANSGGEGFLSAFVILSSLLSYMRKDSSDLFAAGEEGKVLIMDNPFAQTNAAHLLKPLMDMAKKTNTQLICLSGLGGDSIYNRFDNIYVLKLINSNLKQGMQYVSSEHLKGQDIKKMQLAQFVIEEQLSLFE